MRSAYASTARARREASLSRRLSGGEAALARTVFGPAVSLERVRVHGGGFGRFAVTLGSHLFLPRHLARADFARTDLAAQALLVHELVHVWQFQTRPLWTLASWAGTLLRGGYGEGLPGYRYTPPVKRFEALNLEQQASVVEHAFLLGRGRRTAEMPAGLRLGDLASAPFPPR